MSSKEKITIRVTLDLDFDIAPGEYQTNREFEEDGDTYKTLNTVEEIASDLEQIALEEIETLFENADDMRVYEAKKLK